ncbi:hypothetical protein Plec18167_004437 [Paecilomyces lecythidis]|uniref:Methyltransferase-domain-containing protein n=1 Tax=Paecilomyces lecythidis TaxID=3004212 RepID=A0ABR3XQU5_9EURO
MAVDPVDDKTCVAKLVAQYFQLVEPRELCVPSAEAIVRPAVQAAIYEQMFNEATVWPLPPAGYRTRVLKMIISRIEESISNPEEDEIIDDLMTCWSELIAQPKKSPLEQAQQLSYVKYTAPKSQVNEDSRTVVTSESRGLILSAGTTGFRTWEAALHLGTFLSTPEGDSLVRGKRVIELGAGTGFLSLYSAKYLNVQSVLVTDREPALITNIQDCVSRNGLERTKIWPAIWEWGSSLEEPSRGEESGQPWRFDIALGADLIYDVDLVPLLVSTLRDLFENYQLKEFLISATLRNQDTFKAFLDACETNLFQIEKVPFESPPAEAQTGFFHSTAIPIEIYRIAPPLETDR